VGQQVGTLRIAVVGHNKPVFSDCQNFYKLILKKKTRNDGALRVQQFDQLRRLGPRRSAHVQNLVAIHVKKLIIMMARMSKHMRTLWCGCTSMSSGGIIETASWREMLPCNTRPKFFNTNLKTTKIIKKKHTCSLSVTRNV
jgi:hypothetical protein